MKFLSWQAKQRESMQTTDKTDNGWTAGRTLSATRKSGGKRPLSLFRHFSLTFPHFVYLVFFFHFSSFELDVEMKMFAPKWKQKCRTFGVDISPPHQLNMSFPAHLGISFADLADRPQGQSIYSPSRWRFSDKVQLGICELGNRGNSLAIIVGSDWS